MPRPTQKPLPQIDPKWNAIKATVDANNKAIKAILAKIDSIKIDPGQPGEQGPAGADGLAGLAGPPGVAGAKGDTGQPGRDVNDLTEAELGTLARRLVPYLPPIDFRVHGTRGAQSQLVPLGGQIDIYSTFSERTN